MRGRVCEYASERGTDPTHPSPAREHEHGHDEEEGAGVRVVEEAEEEDDGVQQYQQRLPHRLAVRQLCVWGGLAWVGQVQVYTDEQSTRCMPSTLPSNLTRPRTLRVRYMSR